MSYWLYQGLTEPVQVAPQADVSTYAWRNDWREPVRRKFAVALIAAVTTISPFALTQPEASSVDKWYRPFSEPIRKKPGLDASQSVLAWSNFTPAPGVVNTGWLPPWSEPVRAKKRAADFPFLGPVDSRPIVSFGWYEPFAELRVLKKTAQQQQYVAWGTFTPAPQVVFNYYPWSEPVRFRRFPTSEQAYLAQDLRPVVSFGWYGNLSNPVRLKPRLNTPLQSVWTGPHQPTVSFGWYRNLGEPVRIKPRLNTALNPFGALDLKPTVSFGWYGWLTEPVRQKIGIKANLQRFVEFDPFPIINPGTIPWYDNLSEPVRLPIGLKANYQVSFVAPPRVLPNPVILTMSATEENNDIFSAGIVIYEGAARAVVSIEEIPAGSDAVLSIREP